MASSGSSFAFGGELTPATTPRRGAQSIYTPTYASVPPTTPATWSQSPAYNAYNALSNLVSDNLAHGSAQYPYSSSYMNRFIPSSYAVGATNHGLNGYSYQHDLVRDLQQQFQEITLAAMGRAPRAATPVAQESPDDIVINGVKYIKSTVGNAKQNSDTSTHANYQPPSCEPEREGDDIAGPSRTKGKGRADVWDDEVAVTETDTFSQAADTSRDIGGWENATKIDNWGPPTDAGWDNQSAAGTVDDPIQVPGFSDDFLVSVLVGTSAIHELRVLKSALNSILSDPKFSHHKDALNNDQSIVLQGIASNHFQSLVSLVYAGYPDAHILHIMKHYSDTQLVSLYAAGHHFGLQDLCQELIYVLDSRDTSIKLFDLTRNVYSDGHADDDFRGFVRRKIVQMLDQLTPRGFWTEFEAPSVKEKLIDAKLPAILREDVLSVLFDRETARFDAKDSECAATQTEEYNGWGSSQDQDDVAAGRDDKSLFVTGFPASYKSLDIINEVMYHASATSDNSDVDLSLLRRNDSMEGRYIYVTFSTPEAAIAAFEDLVGQEMGFGVHKKAVFVDFAFDDVSKNFSRFEEWK